MDENTTKLIGELERIRGELSKTIQEKQEELTLIDRVIVKTKEKGELDADSFADLMIASLASHANGIARKQVAEARRNDAREARGLPPSPFGRAIAGL